MRRFCARAVNARSFLRDLNLTSYSQRLGVLFRLARVHASWLHRRVYGSGEAEGRWLVALGEQNKDNMDVADEIVSLEDWE